MQTDDDRRAVVRAVHGLLEPGGHFVFDVFWPGAGGHRRDARPLARARARASSSGPTGTSEPRTLILRVRGDGVESELSLAWISMTEWRELLGNEGFVVEGLYGWFDGTRLGGPRGLDLGLPQTRLTSFVAVSSRCLSPDVCGGTGLRCSVSGVAVTLSLR